jgi:hypothetical protein
VRGIHSKDRDLMRHTIKRCDGEGSEGKLVIPLGKEKERTSEYYKE